MYESRKGRENGDHRGLTPRFPTLIPPCLAPPLPLNTPPINNSAVKVIFCDMNLKCLYPGSTCPSTSQVFTIPGLCPCHSLYLMCSISPSSPFSTFHSKEHLFQVNELLSQIRKGSTSEPFISSYKEHSLDLYDVAQ